MREFKNKRFKLESYKISLMGICLLGFIVSSFAAETNITNKSPMPWRFDTLARETDAVVIGRLIPMKGTFLNPYHHIYFYKIDVSEKVAGNHSKLILAVYKNKRTSFGQMVQLEPDMQYMFFLRECEESFEWLPKEGTVYRTVRYWQGVISFDPKAAESRSGRRIKDQYGVDVHNSKEDFINAIKSTAMVEAEEEFVDAEDKQLSADADKIFRVLCLKKGSLLTKAEKGPNQQESP